MPTTATAPARPVDSSQLPPSGAPCESCGNPVEPGDKFCHACGRPQAQPADPSTAAKTPSAAADQKHIRCQNCGAEITVDPNVRSYVCPFCDSTYVVEFSPEKSGRQAPEFVIGFAVAPQQAAEKFQTWIGQGGLFRPSDLKTSQIEEKLRGIYLPFWSFSMLGRSRWSASIGEYWYRTETYTTEENGKTVTHTRQVQETEWWNLAGGHDSYYSGYLVSGSRGLEHSRAERIKPFQLPALKRYDPSFLAGWLSEEYSVSREQALATCQAEFEREEQNQVAAFLPGDTHSSLEVQTEWSGVNSDLILLPVYLLSYKYQNKIYRFLLNGQTGKVAGEKPVSVRRIFLAIAAGLLVMFVLWLIFHH